MVVKESFTGGNENIDIVLASRCQSNGKNDLLETAFNQLVDLKYKFARIKHARHFN